METLKADVVQDIRFARSADGVGIAYAIHGSGPPLLIDACWLSHLQFDWESPVWRHYLVELGKIATVIRYDERGHGLSDRGVTDHSLEARVGDLEAVVEDAGLDRFALMAMAQGGGGEQAETNLITLLRDGTLIVRTPGGVTRQTRPPGWCTDPEPEPPWLDEQAPADPLRL